MNDSVQTNPIGVTKKIPEEKRLTSPYNFVPTGRYIYYPEWEKFASYDHPVKNGMDGTMIVRITNVSPLFIRNGSEKCNSSEKSSCHIPEKEGKNRRCTELCNVQLPYRICSASMPVCGRNGRESPATEDTSGRPGILRRKIVYEHNYA
jgi:hypothetical protein